MKTCSLFCCAVLLCITSALFAQGRTGMALRFDGVDDYLIIPDALSLHCAAEITIEARVSAATFARKDGGRGTPFYNKWKTSYPTQGAWSLAIDTGGCPALVVSADGKDGAYRATSAMQVPRRMWSHVAATYSVATNVLEVFVDGELQARISGPAGLFESDSPILVGAAIYDIPWTRSMFNGAVDELRLWNVVRTQEHIRALMEVPLPAAYYTTADSGLVGYWPCDVIEDLGVFNDGEDDIRDLSVYRNHGDLVGGPRLVSADTPLAADIPPGPAVLSLACVPQPVSGQAVIHYALEKPGAVSLRVFDQLGRFVQSIDAPSAAAGANTAAWDTHALPQGVYNLVFHTRESTRAIRVMVVR